MSKTKFKKSQTCDILYSARDRFTSYIKKVEQQTSIVHHQSLRSRLWRSITAKNQYCNSTFNMGNQHLILPIIFHTAFDNCLPHKHLTTFLHATTNLVGKSKYQKLRFAILKVAICTVESFDLSNSKLQFVKLKIAICQVENCDLPPLVQKPPKLRHTNFVIMTSF
jgi:hypothetical protein